MWFHVVYDDDDDAYVGQRRCPALKYKCDATPIPAQQDFPVLNCPTSPCEKMAFADE